MVVVGEGADGVVADLVVVPDGGGQGEQALADAGAQAGQGAGAVAFQAEFVFGGPDDGFDPLADAAEVPWRWGSSRRSGRMRRQPRSSTRCSKSAPAKPLSVMMVEPGCWTRWRTSAATSRSDASAGASSKPNGIPSGVHRTYGRNPRSSGCGWRSSPIRRSRPGRRAWRWRATPRT